MTNSRPERLNANAPEAAQRAATLLRAGKLVALPTETVYGLAADATSEVAVRGIYGAKGRPSNNPLICHVSGIAMARTLVDINAAAEALMARFWPGPLTLVLPARQDTPVAGPVRAGLDTLAVRMPDHPAMRSVIENLGHPVAAPSANPSGRLSPTTANDVIAGLGDRVDLVLDGGTTPVGIESTIIGIKGDTLTLLRPGTITREAIEAASGHTVALRDANDALTAPGQLSSHYAPDAPVRLNAREAHDGEVLIGFGAIKAPLSLSERGDLEEAATRLFATLRAADKMASSGIAVAPIPNTGIGIALNDRLRRAAAPRNA